MPPIRIAFIGLSAKGGWAARSHLAYLRQTSKFEITGICNSSKEAGEDAIRAYNLPSSVKSYTLEELANDTDSFDLAVCAVRVDKHYASIAPLVAKGKPCFVEWPLTKTIQEAQDLQAIAKRAGNPRTIVGLQGRRSPVVNKVKELINSGNGKIGSVLSVTVKGAAGMSAAIDPEPMGRTFNDKSTGANILSIHFGHMIDFVLYALGQDLGTLSGTVGTQRPAALLKLDNGSLEPMARETPDHIFLQGRLENKALLSVTLRGGPPLKDMSALVWNVYGEKGEIEVTAPGVLLGIGLGGPESIKLHTHEDDVVKQVDFKVNDEEEQLPVPSRNVARVYEAFAGGRETEYATWEEALSRQILLDKIVESSKTATVLSL